MFKGWQNNKKSNFKLRAIKVYGSLENMYRGSRKYRQVYDESECRYLNAELSFYNILFDEADWTTTVRFRAVNVLSGEEMCNFTKAINVSQDDNIVYVHDGWGTPEIGFWKRGVYKWEISINEKVVGKKEFYILHQGPITETANPYFSIESAKLYESPESGMPTEQRSYLQGFDARQTRYINIELQLKNKQYQKERFPLELDFKIYNDTGLLKGKMHLLHQINKEQADIVLDTGYGTEAPGFWLEDNFTIEVVCMDQLIAVVPFEVGTEHIPFNGICSYQDSKSLRSLNNNSRENLSFEEAKSDLERLIGLEMIKRKIDELATILRFEQLRAEKGLKEKTAYNLHSVFMGNPGTGKTTVAKMMGQIYHSLGLLTHGNVHEVTRADLVGEFIGQTAPKVKKEIETARGGVLFIDEAYSLSNRGQDERDYGREVIEVLLKEMSDGPGDLIIICAGYTKEMQQFLTFNPGLNSRFGQKLKFEDYSPSELLSIALLMAEKRDIHIENDALRLIEHHIIEAYRNRNKHFGNARYINSIIEEAKKNLGLRIMNMDAPGQLTKKSLSTLMLADIHKVFEERKPKDVLLPVNEPLLEEAIEELHSMIGMDKIKNQIHETIKLVRYYREIGRDLSKAFSLHTVFVGNPGTGKTTLARLLVRIFKALGILERGHLVECDQKSLIAGFIGQTADKTSEMIDKAIGGGLFIDEAYALTARPNSYGNEVIETLLKRMEDERDKFMLIVAGYPAEMNRFLEANPGLKSRFDKTINFQDYSTEELMEIAEAMFEKEGLNLNYEAETFLKHYIEDLTKLHKNKYFGNARAIRKIVKEAVRKQNLRMAGMPAAERTLEKIETITLDDLIFLEDAEKQLAGGNMIGFHVRKH